MTFLYPYCFLLLIPLCAVLFYAWRKKEPSITVPSIQPYEQALERKKWQADWRKTIPLICYAAAGLLITAALARPQTGTEEARIRAEGIDIMIVIDISTSMLSYDVPQKYRSTSRRDLRRAFNAGELQDRMTIAKAEIRKFIESRPDDRIGLIQFAVGPDLVCPPTLDHGELLAALAAIKPDPDLVGSQTGIAPPLVEAAASMERAKSKNGIIVLFTDGKNNVDSPIQPQDAAKHAAGLNFRVYTVGIGSDYTLYPEPDIFGNLNLIPGGEGFDPQFLKQIAIDGNGKYYSAADPEGMAAVMAEIDRLEKTEIDEKIIVHSKEWYPLLAVLAGIFILSGVACSCVILPKLP